jgi:flagellar biosynthetic protein FliQ
VTAGFIVAAAREMLIVVLTLATPFLAAAILSAAIVGLLQAATHINDLTLSYVPRLAAVMLAIWWSAHWSLARLEAYFEHAAMAVAAFSG